MSFRTEGKERTMPETMPEAVPEHSQVVVFPPVIPLSGFLLGILLERLYPVNAWVWSPLRTGLRVLGAVVLCLGAAGFAWMVVTMKKARTPINNYRTPIALVESGPFRRTRNPMYLFGSIAYAGLALVLVELWALALLAVVFALTHYGVVLREEAFLERRFGDRYRQYMARVPRWL
jgi:protein-S-isoprenylcysteine O-methyltransferase Ste14